MKRAQSITEAKAKTMFQRTLNGWVMDNLRLGRSGLERPSARTIAPDTSRRTLWPAGSAKQRKVG
jgi:hypothetical protein